LEPSSETPIDPKKQLETSVEEAKTQMTLLNNHNGNHNHKTEIAKKNLEDLLLQSQEITEKKKIKKPSSKPRRRLDSKGRSPLSSVERESEEERKSEVEN